MLSRCSHFLDGLAETFKHGFVELEDGWIAPMNGFQYKMSSSWQTWENSRMTCESWNGDLIAHGFQNYETRL